MSLFYECVKAEGPVKKENHKRFARYFPFIVTVSVKTGSYAGIIDNIKYEAKNGETLVIPAHTLHDIEMPTDSVISYSHIYAQKIGEDILSFYEIPNIIKGNASKIIFENNCVLSSVCNEASVLVDLTCDNAISSIIKSILSCPEVSNKTSPGELWILEIRRYISQNITNKIMLSDLCSHFSMSSSRFSEKFKALTGYSPINYVIKMKMEYASSALLSGESVKNIVSQLDIYDDAYFSRLFKRYTGKSPREYIRDYNKAF